MDPHFLEDLEHWTNTDRKRALRTLRLVNAGLQVPSAMHIDATIRNLADRTKSWQGRFLVDTDATDSVVPKCHLEAIGLEPEEQRRYELADGSEVDMGIAGARIEFMDTFTVGIVVFGDTNAEPIIGATALESVGVEIDPHNRRLKRLPAVRLKGMQ